MSNWENFIWIISSPYFIGLFLVSLAIEPFLKFIRRFYSESQKQAVQESEEFIQGLKENKEDRKLFNRANLKIGLFIFGPTFLLFAFYLAYKYLTGEELQLHCMQEKFGHFATIAVTTLGFYTINNERVHKWLFKEDYEKVLELIYKQSGGEESYKQYEKYLQFFGYFFFIVGIVGFVSMFFAQK